MESHKKIRKRFWAVIQTNECEERVFCLTLTIVLNYIEHRMVHSGAVTNAMLIEHPLKRTRRCTPTSSNPIQIHISRFHETDYLKKKTNKHFYLITEVKKLILILRLQSSREIKSQPASPRFHCSIFRAKLVQHKNYIWWGKKNG